MLSKVTFVALSLYLCVENCSALKIQTSRSKWQRQEEQEDDDLKLLAAPKPVVEEQ